MFLIADHGIEAGEEKNITEVRGSDYSSRGGQRIVRVAILQVVS